MIEEHIKQRLNPLLLITLHNALTHATFCFSIKKSIGRWSDRVNYSYLKKILSTSVRALTPEVSFIDQNVIKIIGNPELTINKNSKNRLRTLINIM